MEKNLKPMYLFAAQCGNDLKWIGLYQDNTYEENYSINLWTLRMYLQIMEDLVNDEWESKD